MPTVDIALYQLQISPSATLIFAAVDAARWLMRDRPFSDATLDQRVARGRAFNAAVAAEDLNANETWAFAVPAE